MIPIDRWPGRIRGIGRGAPNTGPASTASTDSVWGCDSSPAQLEWHAQRASSKSANRTFLLLT